MNFGMHILYHKLQVIRYVGVIINCLIFSTKIFVVDTYKKSCLKALDLYMGQQTSFSYL